MTEPAIVFNEVNERQAMFSRRIFLMGGVAGVGLGALAGRLAQLQLVQNDQYKRLSDKNQFNYRLIVPARGLITDRYGTPLASSRGNYRVLVSRDNLKDLDTTLDGLGQIIPLGPERRRQIEKEMRDGPKSAPVAVADDLTWDQFTAISVRAPELPGVTAESGEARVYPYGGAFGHVLGYVSKIDADELKAQGPNPDRLVTHPSFRIGKTGIEKAFDKDLRGVAGGQKLEVDVKGRVVRTDPKGDRQPIQGKTVQLTLDADIQNRAIEVFGQDSGAAVMMDCRTGDILCLASAPNFDVNEFAHGISRDHYAALAAYDHKPLLNKATLGTYPPGSTFKTMVALTALENGYDPRTTHTCGGSFAFGNHVFKCDKSHGTLDLHQAVVTSCDVYFYQCALFCGPDKIAAIARDFGLGQIFDIHIQQKAGVVPDQAWKARRFKNDPANQKWFPGETPSMGIGQGYTNINPLQSCTMVARIANGRKAILPRLIHSIGGVLQPSGADVPDLPVNPDHLAFVRQAMADVVAAKVANATGAQAQLGLDPIMMAGKTGTAQAHTYGGGHGAKGAEGAWALRDHAWFVAFAPADAPRYAISVIVEHGGFGGSAAAPKAREIMRVALLKDPEMRARITHPDAPDKLPPISDAPLEGVAPPPPEQTGPGPALPLPQPLPEDIT
jgi:penicillin-binding protein 2